MTLSTIDESLKVFAFSDDEEGDTNDDIKDDGLDLPEDEESEKEEKDGEEDEKDEFEPDDEDDEDEEE